MTEQLELFQSVHCLLCDHVYPESINDWIIEECPNCGNRDTIQTVYLT